MRGFSSHSLSSRETRLERDAIPRLSREIRPERNEVQAEK